MQLPPCMRAVVYEGGPDPLGVRLKTDLKTPTTGNAMVIVQVLAAALNPIDMKIKAIPFAGNQENKAVGWDFSGVVVYAPAGCCFQVGADVFGFSKRFGEKHGSVAQYVEADPKYLAEKPPSVSQIEAATVPLAGCTSLQALRDCGKVQPGHRVLVIGASGGTGLLGVQIAKIFGCKVTAVCSTKNIPLVLSYGADVAHGYDSSNGPLPAVSDEEKFDCIFDTVTSPDPVDTDYEPLARPLLRTAKDPRVELDASGLEVDVPGRDGVYVAINSKSKWDWVRAITAQLTGVDLQRRGYKLCVYEQRKVDLEWLGAAIADRRMRMRLDDTAKRERFGLEKAEHGRQAFEVLAGRRANGKVAFALSDAVWEEFERAEHQQSNRA